MSEYLINLDVIQISNAIKNNKFSTLKISILKYTIS